MGDISIREYIRWLPDEPSEPTHTIVLTTPQRRFVDVRILKPPAAAGAAAPASELDAPSSDEPVATPRLPLSRLDWAIAGTSESTWSPSTPPGATWHGIWRHWIDSRSAGPGAIVDEGDMSAHPSDPALTLEWGRMANPTTGAAQAEYEELWRSEPVEAVPSPGGGGEDAGKVTSLALQWDGSLAGDRGDDGDGGGGGGKVQRGMVVRLGQYCQGFVRDGDDIAIERLKWDGERQRWITQVRIGDRELPTDVATYFAYDARVDDEVKVGGAVWRVVEKA